ncbi:MAG: hypothetical protein U0228_12440 [Myxococcaceae bacterium]
MPNSRRQVVQGRRYPRFSLDVDWFVESKPLGAPPGTRGASSMGRGLEISVRSALLPVTCTSPLAQEVTLFLSLPLRQQMFKAKCTAVMKEGRGWLLTFVEIAPDDLQLLGHTLITEFGAASLPNVERRPPIALEI